MMNRLAISVTNPDDEIQSELSGSAGNIPVIAFGPDNSLCRAEITLNQHLLTPEEQAAWLRRLAAVAEDLAGQVELLHSIPSGSNYTCSRCDAQFGIAGVSTGSPEDIEADEFYNSEVDYHESGACQVQGA